MPDPKTKVAAILADPEKRKLLHPMIADALERSIIQADVTATPRSTLEAKQAQAAETPVSDVLYRGVTPYNYPDKSRLGEYLHGILHAAVGGDRVRTETILGPHGLEPSKIPTASKEDEDGWRLYLGLPQASGSFIPSPFKPTQAKNPDAQYFSLAKSPFLISGVDVPDGIRLTVNRLDRSGKTTLPNDPGVAASSALGKFLVSKGEDEHGHYLSYYDIYDFNVPGAKLVGKPFEVYGRQYYDPKTYEPLSPDLTNLHLKEIQDWAGQNLPAVTNARPRR